MLMKLQSRLPLLRQLMCRRRRLDRPVSRFFMPGGPSIGCCLACTLSQWNGPGLRRTRWLLIKKLPGSLSTTGGPSTRGTFPSHTCTIFTPIASPYRRWLVARSTPYPSLPAWIRGSTNVWQRKGCTCVTMTLIRQPTSRAEPLTLDCLLLCCDFLLTQPLF